MKRVKFIQSCAHMRFDKNYRFGEIIDLEDGFAYELVEGGVAIIIEDVEPKIELPKTEEVKAIVETIPEVTVIPEPVVEVPVEVATTVVEEDPVEKVKAVAKKVKEVEVVVETTEK